MKDSLRRRYLFFLVNYFVQGSIGIVYEPLNYLLKDKLRFTTGQTAGFIAWISLPFLLKPLFGLIADLRPIGGHRRKPYLLGSSVIATLGFLLLAAQSQYYYLGVMIPMVLANFGIAFADSACGGLLVEDGKERQQTGPYQAIQIGALYLSMVLCGVGGGWITAHWSYRTIFSLTAILSLAMFASALIVNETEYCPRRGAAAEFWNFAKTKRFWALCITILLWNFYPFLGTVQFYYQSNVLKLGPVTIGAMATLGSIAGLIGSAVYLAFSRRGKVSRAVTYGPATMAVISSLYLLYRGPVSVAFVETIFGFANVFFRLALLDLIARSCPTDAEATSFAVFLGVFDFAMYASNTTGGKLYDILQKMFAAAAHPDRCTAAVLIIFGALCTFACNWTLPKDEPAA